MNNTNNSNSDEYAQQLNKNGGLVTRLPDLACLDRPANPTTPGPLGAYVPPWRRDNLNLQSMLPLPELLTLPAGPVIPRGHVSLDNIWLDSAMYDTLVAYKGYYPSIDLPSLAKRVAIGGLPLSRMAKMMEVKFFVDDFDECCVIKEHRPPVKLSRSIRGGFLINDGRHRVCRAIINGEISIEAVVSTGHDDYIIAGGESNPGPPKPDAPHKKKKKFFPSTRPRKDKDDLLLPSTNDKVDVSGVQARLDKLTNELNVNDPVSTPVSDGKTEPDPDPVFPLDYDTPLEAIHYHKDPGVLGNLFGNKSVRITTHLDLSTNKNKLFGTEFEARPIHGQLSATSQFDVATDQFVLDAMMNYIRLNQSHSYSSRDECYVHSHKLGLKYLELAKIKIHTMTAFQTNCFLITVQKATDSGLNQLLTCYKSQQREFDRTLSWKQYFLGALCRVLLLCVLALGATFFISAGWVIAVTLVLLPILLIHAAMVTNYPRLQHGRKYN